MRIVKVPLGNRSYEIRIGTGLLARLADHCARLKLQGRCAIISDTHVAPRYSKALLNALGREGFDSTLITVPARIAYSARRLRLHLPQDWPWETAWKTLFNSLFRRNRPLTA